MKLLVDEALLPGKVMAVSLLDPGSRAVLIPAGTALTPELIATIHRRGLAARAAMCLGEEKRELPAPRPAPVAQFPREVQQRRRKMHQSLGSLRTLLAVGALGAGLFAGLAGDRRDAALALAGMGLLFVAFLASFKMANRTRAILRAPQAPIAAIKPREAAEEEQARSIA